MSFGDYTTKLAAAAGIATRTAGLFAQALNKNAPTTVGSNVLPIIVTSIAFLGDLVNGDLNWQAAKNYGMTLAYLGLRAGVQLVADNTYAPMLLDAVALHYG